MFDLILWACFISNIIVYLWPPTWPQEWSQVVIDDHKAKSRLITMKLHIVRSHFESLFILYHYWPIMTTHVTTRVVESGQRWPQIKVSTYNYEVTYCSISFWKFINFVSLLTVYDYPRDLTGKQNRSWMTINHSLEILQRNFILIELIIRFLFQVFNKNNNFVY